MGLENLDAWKLATLLLLGLLVFGDRLPKVIDDGLRVLRQLRDMARTATGELSRELGTDIQIEDLHPTTLIRKHLLNEDDEAALRKPLDELYQDLRTTAASLDPTAAGTTGPDLPPRPQVGHVADPEAT